MKLSVTGIKHCQNLTLREARYALGFFSNKLLSKRLDKRLNIFVQFQHMKDNWQGGTYYNQDIPRDFVLRIKPTMSRQLTLKTLAHEMVHVKQWSTCERKDCRKTDLVIFRKECYDESEIHYADLPWEKEATAAECRLLNLYFRHIKRRQLKF